MKLLLICLLCMGSVSALASKIELTCACDNGNDTSCTCGKDSNPIDITQDKKNEVSKNTDGSVHIQINKRVSKKVAYGCKTGRAVYGSYTTWKGNTKDDYAVTDPGNYSSMTIYHSGDFNKIECHFEFRR